MTQRETEVRVVYSSNSDDGLFEDDINIAIADAEEVGWRVDGPVQLSALGLKFCAIMTVSRPVAELEATTCAWCDSGFPVERYLVPDSTSRVESKSTWRHGPFQGGVYRPCVIKHD